MGSKEADSLILLVEDDYDNRISLEMVLSQNGCKVVSTDGGYKAIDMIRKNPFDLIIADVNMPVMDGFTFRKKLLEDPEAKQIPFMFLTARRREEDLIRGLRQGVEEYLMKPVDPDVLIAYVRAILSRKKRYAEQYRLDPLTGLLRKDWVEQEIVKELGRRPKMNFIGSLVFLDVDDFKLINDSFGHLVGDEVLKSLGELLRKKSRAMDIIGRFGGEEFLLYLLNTRKSQAAQTISKLLDEFKEKTFTHTDMHVTFSAGIAQYPLDGEQYIDLCRKADRAMYLAKQKGKGKVICWES